MTTSDFTAKQMTGQSGFGDLTSEERKANLALAARVRVRRAEICTELRQGRRTARALLEAFGAKTLSEPDHKALKGLKARSFLLALPGIGPAKADQAMDDCNIKPNRKLQGIGPAQRARLITWLEARNVE